MCEVPVSVVIQRLQALRRDGHFAQWTLDDIECVGTHCPVVEFHPGDMLFHRGEVALWFGCILEGKCTASVDGTDLKLGEKGVGEWIGTSRALNVPNNHMRPYSLRVNEGGFLLWVTYRTFWAFEKTNPRLYYVLSHSLYAAQLEYAANFFTGQPFATKWTSAELTVRRILEALIRFRDRKLLFVDCDDAALLGLAGRVRTASFQAAECLQSRNSPCYVCHIVLSGKVAVFDDPTKGPSSRLSAGTVFGVNAILAPHAVCPYDVFASATTSVALVTAECLRCLGNENPTGAAHILGALVDASLHSQAFPAAALLSEGYELMRRAPERVTGLYEQKRLQNTAQLTRLTEHIEMREGKGFLGDFCSRKHSEGLLSPKRRARSYSPQRKHTSVASASTKCSTARARLSGRTSTGTVGGAARFAIDEPMTSLAEDVRRARLASSMSPHKWHEPPRSQDRIEKLIKRPLTAAEQRRLRDHSPDDNKFPMEKHFSEPLVAFRDDYRKDLLSRLKKWGCRGQLDDESWNLMAVKYDEEAQFLWHELDMLSQENRRLTLCLSEVTKERDAWKQKSLKGKLNYEFEESLADWRAHNQEPKLVGGRIVYN
eukprot:GEMP01021627.1.p1 GENE.GEMP01021627.1~~GEMP01021627.1.p1  ORF type:complete len:600 (+),score=147.99 GEMP01021627.1:166-1965(+)